jgi:alpha-L-rhamnosidase
MSDGGIFRLSTDATWTARESGVLADDLYDGQRTDLRPRTRTGERSDTVEVVDADLARLVAPDGPPVRVTQTLPAVAVSTSPSGATLVDFGQNLVGWVRLRVRDQAPGQEVVVRHAEVLEHGELGVRPLRSAKATDSYRWRARPWNARAEFHLPRLPVCRDPRSAGGGRQGRRGGGRGL